MTAPGLRDEVRETLGLWSGDVRAAARSGRLTRSAALAALGLAMAGGLALLGTLVSAYGWIVVGFALFLVMAGATTIEPAAVPILTMPALVVIERAAGDLLSVSDLGLFCAFWFALVFTGRPYTPAMRTMLWLSVVYQAATLFTVIANPYIQNTIEWFHAWLSVGGALVVGFAVGRSGYHRLGLALFILPCLAIALLTIATAAIQLSEGNTGPVYLTWPIDMHKNFVGCVLGFAAVLAYARPHWTGWPRPVALLAFWVCSLGVIASQARQAMVGLAVGVVIVALRPDPDRKRSRVILLGVVPVMIFVASVVREQLQEGNEFNSAYQRLSWYQQALEVWQMNPWFGVGLRWWVAGRTPYYFQPPNAELEVLSSTGVVGLAGFLVLFLGAVVVLWRMDPRYGTTAVALIATRFAQGQFDLFWSSVVVSVPFVIAGVALGAQAYAQNVARRDADPAPDDPVPVPVPLPAGVPR